MRNFFGFTLIELLITISILAVISALTVPAYGNFTDSNAVRQAALNLATDIELVKSKALAGAYTQSCTVSNRDDCKANWGIKFCTDNFNIGSDTENNFYVLTAFDDAGGNTWPDEINTDTDVVTQELNSGVNFVDGAPCVTNNNTNSWIFSRLNGLPINITNANNTVQLERNGITHTITIDPVSGKLSFE